VVIQISGSILLFSRLDELILTLTCLVQISGNSISFYLPRWRRWRSDSEPMPGGAWVSERRVTASIEPPPAPSMEEWPLVEEHEDQTFLSEYEDVEEDRCERDVLQELGKFLLECPKPKCSSCQDMVNCRMCPKVPAAKVIKQHSGKCSSQRLCDECVWWKEWSVYSQRILSSVKARMCVRWRARTCLPNGQAIGIATQRGFTSQTCEIEREGR